jgi:hypothetical protein
VVKKFSTQQAVFENAADGADAVFLADFLALGVGSPVEEMATSWRRAPVQAIFATISGSKPKRFSSMVRE